MFVFNGTPGVSLFQKQIYSYHRIPCFIITGVKKLFLHSVLISLREANDDMGKMQIQEPALKLHDKAPESGLRNKTSTLLCTDCDAECCKSNV